MTAYIAQIAKSAFDRAALAIDGVVKVATISHDTKGAYNTTTGVYAVDSTPTATGRAVFGTASALRGSFPAFIAGPADMIISLEGFTTVPQVGWSLTIDGVEMIIKAVGDIAGAGVFFEVIAS